MSMQTWSNRVLNGQISVTEAKIASDETSPEDKAQAEQYLELLREEKSRREKK